MAKRGQNDPAKVVKRKSYYGFSRDYPAAQGGRNTYLIGDSNTMRRRGALACAAYILMLVLLFVLAFVITSAALDISGLDPESVTGQAAAEQTAHTPDGGITTANQTGEG